MVDTDHLERFITCLEGEVSIGLFGQKGDTLSKIGMILRSKS